MATLNAWICVSIANSCSGSRFTWHHYNLFHKEARNKIMFLMVFPIANGLTTIITICVTYLSYFFSLSSWRYDAKSNASRGIRHCVELASIFHHTSSLCHLLHHIYIFCGFKFHFMLHNDAKFFFASHCVLPLHRVVTKI